MAMTADLRDYWRDQGVAGGNVYRDHRPTTATLPAVVIETITDPRTPFMKGEDGLVGARVQINCLHGSRAEADALRDAALAARPVRTRIGTTDFRRLVVDGGGTDFDRPQSGDTTYRTRVDLIVWHRPATAPSGEE